MKTESPPVGSVVRVKKTGAHGRVVEVDRKHQTCDVDLGEQIIAEMTWDEVEVEHGPPAASA
jgi:hypothetical protein